LFFIKLGGKNMAFQASESITKDNLFSGTQIQPVTATSATVVSGEGVLARGSVMGRVTASGKLKLVKSTAEDGSKTPYGILADAVDATSADATAVIFLTGEFNTAALTFGGTDTAADHEAEARKVGLIFKSNI
jgi:hypothetical protein